MKAIKPAYLFFLFAVALIFFNPLATTAARYNQESSLTAAAVYTSYRVINRVASMASDADVQFGLLAASVSFSPGRVLQSFLDTLQRFADMLFPLMVVSGVLSVVLVPLAQLGAVLASAGLALRIALSFRRSVAGAAAAALSRLARALVSAGMLAALVVPGAYSAGYLIGDGITAASWTRAVAAFQSFASDLETAEEALVEMMAPEEPPPASEEEAEEGNVFSNVWGGIAAGTEALTGAVQGTVGGVGSMGGQAWELVTSVPQMMARAGELVSASLQFLIAYLIKTLVIPLIIGALVLWLWRQVAAAPRAVVIEQGPARIAPPAGQEPPPA